MTAWWPDRWLTTVYLAFIILGSGIWPLAVYEGYLTFARLGLCAFFFFGALMMVIGYIRYIPGGPTAPALLVLQLGKAMSFAALGLGFFVLSLTGGNSPVTPGLFVVYVFFGAAASTMFFPGAYLFIGAGRGWITSEAYWFPWVAPRGNKDK